VDFRRSQHRMSTRRLTTLSTFQLLF
jgi:hypothetical protein